MKKFFFRWSRSTWSRSWRNARSWWSYGSNGMAKNDSAICHGKIEKRWQRQQHDDGWTNGSRWSNGTNGPRRPYGSRRPDGTTRYDGPGRSWKSYARSASTLPRPWRSPRNAPRCYGQSQPWQSSYFLAHVLASDGSTHDELT